ncbi:YKL069W-like protein [Fimicolochytrium jonesii]|uniref:YKL069W-like protein n=1 Tax=Fimicolochytrium jonesii TaxID=1396493 RepID=UPI0022FECD44|nr:YKL069W-like protein [Fimicolochytrium jonesii]KAI8826881.1 YKL069W-like protein [Fimicolochytrium jonesii]
MHRLRFSKVKPEGSSPHHPTLSRNIIRIPSEAPGSAGQRGIGKQSIEKSHLQRTSATMLETVPGFAYPLAKPAFYAAVLEQTSALVDPSLPLTSNLANFSALLFHAYRDPPVSREINWLGFYLTKDVLDGVAGVPEAGSPPPKGPPKLILAPFQGRVACTIIPPNKGVCGAAAATASTQLVPDVHLFPGHIACDSNTESELVVPIVVGGRVVGVLDIDCLVKEGFDEEDRVGVDGLVKVLVETAGFK